MFVNFLRHRHSDILIFHHHKACKNSERELFLALSSSLPPYPILSSIPSLIPPQYCISLYYSLCPFPSSSFYPSFYPSQPSLCSGIFPLYLHLSHSTFSMLPASPLYTSLCPPSIHLNLLNAPVSPLYPSLYPSQPSLCSLYLSSITPSVPPSLPVSFPLLFTISLFYFSLLFSFLFPSIFFFWWL
jgi:hypothetical protein